jgi:hypothetical protein
MLQKNKIIGKSFLHAPYWRKIRATGFKISDDDIVWAKKLANRYLYSREVPFRRHDDTVSEGLLGLVCASKNYDNTRCTCFRGYAKVYIIGYMKRYLWEEIQRDSIYRPFADYHIECGEDILDKIQSSQPSNCRHPSQMFQDGE